MEGMTVDSSSGTPLAAHVGGPAQDGPTDLRAVPSEPFDIEPPYDAAASDLPADRFLDRELSWLRFNTRVLELAEDPTLPLLERVRFLAIFASNLDEFFMVRVAGLKRRIAAGVAVPAASGLMPREVLEQIWSTTSALMARQARLFRDEIVPALAKEDIELLRWNDLSLDEQKQCKRLFKNRVFPVLTPLAVDPAHPFPYISGLSLNLAVLVRNPKTDKEHFARVKVPPIFARFVPVGEQRFVPLEDVISDHMKRLFPGMEVLGVHTFRVTRNEDLEVEEDDAENLLAALEKELLRRRFGPLGAARGRGVDGRPHPRPAGLRARRLARRGGPAARPARPDRPARHRRPRPGRAEVPRVRAVDPLAARRGGDGLAGRRVQGGPPLRRTPAPPVRLVLHLGAALHRAGRGRPARAGDQADAVPHLR